ncbi:MAG: hypothetical protein Q6362_003885 [Candidatus Wukongarchaeota archaeon]|nr:hypothetical protein [Candidatus Wukongarchaeota archaeon]
MGNREGGGNPYRGGNVTLDKSFKLVRYSRSNKIDSEKPGNICCCNVCGRCGRYSLKPRSNQIPVKIITERETYQQKTSSFCVRLPPFSYFL